MKAMLRSLVSYESRQALRFDTLRLRTRMRRAFRSASTAPGERLHFGCGARRVPGWLNADLTGSDWDVDLTRPLPWADGQFSTVVSQHVVEHLELRRELLPLLREVRRVCRPGAELWVSTPDLEVVCRSYLDNRGQSLIDDRLRRHPGWAKQFADVPPQQVVNHLFHQMGQHKNLFDFELLAWALDQAGFRPCERVREADLLARFPEFPRRNDDFQTLYVRARAVPPANAGFRA
jgi:predicted SAM-dependent methyltransferase